MLHKYCKKSKTNLNKNGLSRSKQYKIDLHKQINIAQRYDMSCATLGVLYSVKWHKQKYHSIFRFHVDF